MDTTTQTGPVAGQPAVGSQPAAPAGNGASLRLPPVDEILAKRAAGQKLTKAEAARLSWVNRKPRPAAASAPSAAAAGAANLVAGLADGRPEALPPPPQVDEALCRTTAGELLDTLNHVGQDYISAKARSAGATPATAQPFLERAALKDGQRTAMVDTAPRWLPRLLRIAGLNPEHAPDALAGAAALMWGFGIVSVSLSLEKKAQEKAEAEKANKDKPEPANGSAAP